jgi:D-alanine-D-alanine ligase
MSVLHVAVVREDVSDAAAPDALDTVRQARSVAESLALCGWRACEHVFGHDPSVLEAELERTRPDVVFNLVESWSGLASLACVAPALFRKAGLAFTGADEGSMALAGDKAWPGVCCTRPGCRSLPVRPWKSCGAGFFPVPAPI